MQTAIAIRRLNVFTRACVLPVAVAGLLIIAHSASAAFPGSNGKIAFDSTQPLAGIWTMDAQGSRSSVGPGRSPAWSQDGKKLAFTAASGPSDLWVMNADGSAKTSIALRAVGTPAWSPDGTKLAFTRRTSPGNHDEIWTINADGTGAANVAPETPCYSDGPTVWAENIAPAWSPDGSKVAFVRFGCYDDNDFARVNTGDVYIMNPDGSGRQLVFEGIGEGWFDEYSGVSMNALSWSPDGSTIAMGQPVGAYCTQYGGPELPCSPGIWTVRMNQSFIGRQLTTEEDGHPAWSPDASQIAFHRWDGSRNTIWTMAADGLNEQQLTPSTSTASDANPDWQPVGAVDPYPRPAFGTPIFIPLVPAYEQCTTPNTEHAPPLQLSSCAPPREESSVLTTSTVGKGFGWLRLRAVAGNPSTPEDEADIAVDALATDVRCRSLSQACPNDAGSDFEGAVLFLIKIRLTDRASGFGGVSATVSDVSLNVPMPCTATAGTGVGSRCEVHTTADALVPGWVKEEKRTILSTLSVELRDPGLNGTGYGSCPPTCGDGDETTYMREGVVTP